MKTKFSILVIFFASNLLHAQEFNLKRVELAGDKLLIFYDLKDTVKNRHYTINVYASSDNYLAPLQKLEGDAGLEVPPGVNRKIVWKAKEELGAEFEGSVGLEIRGRLYVPFVRLSDFEDYKVRKRAVPFTVTWTGGSRQNALNFDLYNNDNTKVWTQANVANNGNFELKIPTHVKPGSGYRFKISDNKNKEDVVYSSEFSIKRRVPLLLKIIPTVALAGLGYLLLQGGPEATSEPTGIINAPCPDGTNNCNN